MDSLYDIIIIGAGIHGVAIGADAAGRGLRVLICEQDDLASATSSASSKLIHGGLRYLEHYEFSLVLESLRERSRLIKMAPHLIHPLRFVIPINHSNRPLWQLRTGLYLYDLMGLSSHFTRSKLAHFDPISPSNPLRDNYKKGLLYSDASVDDARLVITTALRAKQKGAIIFTRTKCIEANPENNQWHVKLENQIDRKIHNVFGKIIINASGPWMNYVTDNIIKQKSAYRTRLVKGSHIVVPQIIPEDKAYLLQHSDGRVVFVIPYYQQFTMIGTTDVPYDGELTNVHIDEKEIDYLCNIVSTYFNAPLRPHQLVSSWSGVRPLVADNSPNAADNTREYKLELVYSDKFQLPILNIYGGKLTTHRKLAEKAINLLKPLFPQMSGPWTAKSPLPGGALPKGNLSVFIEGLVKQYSWLPLSLLTRYAKSYGTLTHDLLWGASRLLDLGEHFGHGLYELELKYLIKHEWAMTTQDILWRRSKLGLLFTEKEQENLNNWMNNNIC